MGRRAKLTLLALMLLFFGPMAVSMVMYFTSGGWRPAGSTAHGILLQLPLTLDETPWVPGDGEPAVMRGKWQLIHLVDGDCDETCQADLVETRQVRRALGREMGRVQRVLWVGGSPPAPELLQAEHPGLRLLTPLPDEAARIRAALGPVDSGHVLLVDPLGNLIMHFPQGTTMKDMHDDVKLLLRASQIG
jgi:hypothetical protein